ncbi:bifunctional 5,10-methylenetetrahydrofolate dehydrogenase/5,10-methenyltetrahydrofolate cyclohydrolase [Sphaerisporangium aureirubrum]|uniref:Bifunctional protein FolD n=1 Tax=Sphaerisporangium aureirubrum TaxID=1544736 RepID=A0ABW1NIU2_9ACTN
MTATALSGKELATEIRAETAARAAELTAAGRPPTLAVVVATADESSAWYVRSIARAAEKAGVHCDVIDVGPHAAAAGIAGTLVRLNADDAVHGVILQTPLPEGVNAQEMALAIDVGKDVDGANPASLGRLAAGLPAFAPATAQAVVAILDHHGIELSGRPVAMVGRSTVVGKPAAHLLLDRNATVTICHSRTRDLAAVTRAAEVVVAAVGRAGLITAEYVSPGAVVVDVGTNPTGDGGLAGDVDAASVGAVAAALTPVPGGVGPVTTALLLSHTVQAAARVRAGG